jgi:3-isopropylmalate/(R)-2-methylmalate dehydratase large subunit
MGANKAVPQTLIDKIWQLHLVADLGQDTDLIYVDRHFMHERSGGRMLDGVARAGRQVYDTHLTYAVLDHLVDTDSGRTDVTKAPGGTEFISFFREKAQAAGIELIGLDDARQGIVHVIAPELGIALPGMTLVCGDSHTCTMGGIGALAWGIGVTQGEHALSTQCVPLRRPRQMRVWIDGEVSPHVYAKDVILYLIGHAGAAGGQGCAIEFAGDAITAMAPEARMTLCNMAVEFGGWTGIVAPDDKVFDYFRGRSYAPQGDAWDEAVAHWRWLVSDPDAVFDEEIRIDAGAIEPQVTWGTSGEHVTAISTGRVPDPNEVADPSKRDTMRIAQAYMSLAPGDAMQGVPIDAAFIGSCTNARIGDLRAAAALLKDRHVAAGVLAVCVPGSTSVRRQAEAEGLDNIFRAAGFQWREAGCSLCFYAGGDSFGAARRVISTTNRNFQNRQGPGVRTHLASPATVAASALMGKIADPRHTAH